MSAVVACGYFSASAAQHWVEATAAPLVLDSAMRGNAATAPPRANLPTPKSKLGEPLAARNIFCSECVRVTGPKPPDATEHNQDGIPSTKLPIQLLVTNVAQRSDWSFATIRNPQSGHQGAFGVGDVIPAQGGGAIASIQGSSVVFHNVTTKRLEKVSLVPPREKAEKGGSSSSKAPKDRATGRGIRKLNATTYELDRDLVTRTLRNFRSVRGARFRPYVRRGKMLGFRAYGVRPNSIPAQMGLRNGDVITGANGEALDSMDAMLSFYRKLRELSRVEVSVDRRRKPMTLTYVLK